MGVSRPLSLLESAEVLGHIRYVELAAFERLGHRARRSSSAPLAAYLAGASLAHAWRASLVEDHLPVSLGLPGPAELTRSPGDDVDQVLGLLGPEASPPGGHPGPPAEGGGEPLAADGNGGAGGAAPGRGADEELVEALVGVLYPAMLAGYERRIAIASPASDPPLVRALRRAAADLAAVIEEGRPLVSEAPAGPDPQRSPSALPGGLRGRLTGLLGRRSPFGPIGQDT